MGRGGVMQKNKKKYIPTEVAKKEEIKTKIFVLDTNVLMHDPLSLFAFKEHDVYIPPEVLEEIDNHKKGHEEIALNSRHTMRTLDTLLSHKDFVVGNGIDLTLQSEGVATGKLFVESKKNFSSLHHESKVDNRILDFVHNLARKHKGRMVILVSKDINMRIKARMRGLAVEDYHSDMVIKDTDHLETGIHQLPKNFWLTNGNNLHSGVKDGESYYEVTGDFADKLGLNQFVYNDESGENQFTGRVKERRGKTTTIVVPRNYITPSNAVWKICARNREQSFALNLLMDPSVDLVTLLGPAGCGKTLLTLAAGFEQVVSQRKYRKIVFTRTPIPVGEEIGFLPGTEEEKLFPWMGAFTDNLEVLLHTGNGNGDKGKKEEKGKEAHTFQREYIMEKVEIKSLTFMRGRSFLNTFLVVDEAQNLTPRQMKMLVTRAGNGTKVVILGNLDQIDTPYLSAGGSGLAYVVDRFKNYPRGGHLILPEGERSPLANYANTVL